MKKFFICLLPSLFLLFSCATNPKESSMSSVIPVTTPTTSTLSRNRNVKSAQIEADVIFSPQTLKEVEEYSTYIVQGILLDDASQKLRYYDNLPVFGITVSSFKITKVYKGNLKTGDMIQLGEKYYSVGDGGDEIIYHFGNYMPSEVGKEYLFFLADHSTSGDWWKDIYSPISWEKGRYPVLSENLMDRDSIDSMTNEELNLGKDDATDYKNIYKEVIAKYMS